MSLLGAAAIAGAASLLSSAVGGLFGSKSNSSTNKRNLQIARESNAFNAAEAQKTRNFTLDMFNRYNEYNSPAAQLQRYKDAGINPYFALGQFNPSSAQYDSGAQASATSNPTLTPTDYSFVSQGINNAVSQIMAYKMNEAQVANVQSQTDLANIDGAYRAAKLQSEIAKTLADTDVSKSQKEGLNLANDYLSQTFKMRVNQEQERTFQQIYQTEIMRQESLMQSVKLDMSVFERDNLQPAQLKQLETNIKTSIAIARAQSISAAASMVQANTAKDLARHTSELIDQQAEEARQNAYSEIYRRTGIKLDNQQKRIINGALNIEKDLYNTYRGSSVGNKLYFFGQGFNDVLSPLSGGANFGIQLKSLFGK